MEIGMNPNNSEQKLKLPSKNNFLLEKEIFGGSLKDFKILCELGRGSFGTVYKAESLLNNKECVIKKIDINALKQKDRKNAIKEVTILKKLKHPNIIKFYNSFEEENSLYIVMEYAEGGDLQKQINARKVLKQHFSEQEIWEFAEQIALALSYLHSHKIIHRDIKALNIFVDKNQKIKLGDLGVSKIVANQMAINGTRVGTPLYLAPELVKHQPYDNKIDIWALGCVLYYLSALEPPFTGENLISLGYNIVNRIPKNLPKNYSENLINFIMALLEKDYEKRKPLTKILELIPSDKKTPAKKEKKKSIIQNEENVLKNNEPQPKEIRSQFPSFELKIKEDKSKIAQNSFINVLEIANEEAPLPRNNKNSLDLKKEDEKKKENGKKEIENKTKEITEKQIYEPNSESEKINQKFKIRPCSANVMMNKIKENKEIPPKKINEVLIPKQDKKEKNNSLKIEEVQIFVPLKQNLNLFRPKSAIVPKINAFKTSNPILSSRLTNNFVKNEEVEQKKANIEFISDEGKEIQEKEQIKENFGTVCPEIKEFLPYSTNNLHSVFYENNKQNNLNSNFFFQIFGVQKQIEKTTKFYSNTSGNSSTLQAANTVRKKDEFSEITERTVYPKKLLQSRDEFLNRKTKAVSSLNFFHQCSKPNASENKNDRQSYHYGLVQNPSLKNPLNEFLFQNRSKKIFCLKDLTDV